MKKMTSAMSVLGALILATPAFSEEQIRITIREIAVDTWEEKQNGRLLSFVKGPYGLNFMLAARSRPGSVHLRLDDEDPLDLRYEHREIWGPEERVELALTFRVPEPLSSLLEELQSDTLSVVQTYGASRVIENQFSAGSVYDAIQVAEAGAFNDGRVEFQSENLPLLGPDPIYIENPVTVTIRYSLEDGVLALTEEGERVLPAPRGCAIYDPIFEGSTLSFSSGCHDVRWASEGVNYLWVQAVLFETIQTKKTRRTKETVLLDEMLTELDYGRNWDFDLQRSIPSTGIIKLHFDFKPPTSKSY